MSFRRSTEIECYLCITSRIVEYYLPECVMLKIIHKCGLVFERRKIMGGENGVSIEVHFIKEQYIIKASDLPKYQYFLVSPLTLLAAGRI